MVTSSVPSSSLFSSISNTVCKWYDEHHRALPWRDINDAYRIWLSEIILQQTRVVQGLDYYRRFVARFPTVADLAAAPEDEIMKLWQGLGYYSRARNLYTAAQQVMNDFGGIFPTSYKELRCLKGVGPYTAAAIASFSSGEAVAVVDGNVYRVLARLFDIDIPIDSNEGSKFFQALAEELLDRKHAGLHNQAMMEFGAMQCTPTSPSCEICPLLLDCQSYRNGTITRRPVKKQKIKVSTRHLHYLIFSHGDRILAHKREANDIWQGLYEFVLIEKNEPTSIDRLLKECLSEKTRSHITRITPLLLQRKHQLTHRLLLADFYLIETSEQLSPDEIHTENNTNHLFVTTLDEWKKLAVPKLISDANIKLFNYFHNQS